ncbi:hypothetical protein E3N88_15476 [Mikania micrantha]|uniref:Uncharacterized protein n=1 Tax=Mikania micrantha TaxID=192012 RepID=A0A5N6NYA8_9ASTR|nr:hypothetical protein E3N88_15476 [Mikania micrantha]
MQQGSPEKLKNVRPTRLHWYGYGTGVRVQHGNEKRQNSKIQETGTAMPLTPPRLSMVTGLLLVCSTPPRLQHAEPENDCYTSSAPARRRLVGRR